MLSASVVSINRSIPAVGTTNASSVSFAVVFSEAVSGVDQLDFAVVKTGSVAILPLQAGSVTQDVGNPASYLVTVSGITGEGTLGLNLVDNGTIKDLTGHGLYNNPGGPTAFLPQTTFGVGTLPYTVAIGDVNGDGKPDLITGNASNVSALLGTGTGAFTTPAQNTTAGNNVQGVAIGDVDGDGTPDLVTANYGSGTVSVLHGNHNGTFSLISNINEGGSPSSIELADVNNDGHLDLITAINSSNTFRVQLGHSTGMFDAPLVTGIGGAPRFIATADLNHDGNLDVVVTSGTGSVATMFGDGLGSFGFFANYSVGIGTGPYSLAIADFNHDGKLDIVTSNSTTNNVSVLLGTGVGTFGVPLKYTVGTTPLSVTVEDVNGDGKPDIVTANRDGNSVSVLLGNGAGGFSAAASFPVGLQPYSVRIADLNGDGRPDLVTTNRLSNNVSVLLNAANGNFTGQTYTIDHVPTVTSIVRSNPAPASTNATSVTFAVTFSEPVTGVDATDFVLAKTGTVASTTTVVSVSATGYLVTVSGLTGDGTLGLNLTNNGSIKDASSNGLSSSFTGQTYTLDHLAPEVLSINRSNPIPATTNASSVTFAVTFTEAVTGVDSADFAVVKTGSVASTSIQVTGSGSNYLVTVSGITGSGTLGLNLVKNGTVKDLVSNVLGLNFIGQIYTIDHTPPSVISISRAVPITASPNSFSFAVTFSEPVTGVDAADFLVTKTGDVVTTTVKVTGSGKDYVVTVIGTICEGTLGLNLVNNSTIKDLAGNSLNGNFTGQTYAADHTSPHVISINLNNPLTTVTNANQMKFSVTFSEAVTGVDPTDFVIVKTGSLVGTVSSVTGGGKDYVVTISNITGSGTLGLNLVDNNSIRDLGGNSLNNNPNGPPTYSSPTAYPVSGQIPYLFQVADLDHNGTLDLVAALADSPGKVSVLLGNGDGTFGAATTFSVGGDSPLSIAIGDVDGDTHPDIVTVTTDPDTHASMVKVLKGNGHGLFAAPVSFATADSAQYIALADLDGGGLDIVTTSASEFDANTNTFGAGTVSVLRGNGHGSFAAPTNYSVGQNPSSVTIADVENNGTLDIVTSNASSGDVSVLLGTGTGSFGAASTFSVDASNPSSVAVADINEDGNPDLITANLSFDDNNVTVLLGNGSGSFGAASHLVVSGGALSVVVADMNGDCKPDIVIGSQAIAGTVSILLGNGTGTFAPATEFPGSTTQSGYQPAIAVADINGDGRLDMLTSNAQPADSNISVLLNLANGNFTGQTYQIDHVAPSVVKIYRNNPLGPITNATTVTFAVTFSEPVTGVDITDFALAKTGTVVTTLTTVTGSGTSYLVTVSGITGNGFLGLNLIKNGTIKDAASNALSNSLTGQAYTIDQIAPKVVSINRNIPVAATTNATSVSFFVTFSEAVTGVDALDFALSQTGTVNGTVTQVLGNSLVPNVFLVTISGITGNGILGLNLINNSSIKDLAGNSLSNSSIGQTYTIDNLAPTVLSIDRKNPISQVTSATSVTFVVMFSEPVTGVDVADFVLSKTGSAVGTLFSVTPAIGSATTYLVTVNGVRGYGDLGLNLINNNSIKDASGNLLIASFSSGQTYTIDHPPIDIYLANRSIAENSANGRFVGYLLGTDFDSGDTLSFSFAPSGNANGRFAINGNEIVVADGGLLNFEANKSHNVTIRATDSKGLTFDKVFVIIVTDVNEVPTSLLLSCNTLARNMPIGTNIGTLSATDPDAGDTFTYSLPYGSTYFTLSADGKRLVSKYVFPNSTPPGTKFTVTVRVTDAHGLSMQRNVDITVT